MRTADNIYSGTAIVDIIADNSKLKKALDETKSKIERYAAGFRTIGLQLNIIGQYMLAPFKSAVSVFSAFDDQMRMVQAVTSAGGAALEEMTAKAKELGATTAFTASQVAGCMGALGRMGFNPDEINAAIKPMMALSQATGTEISLAAQIAANNLKVFRMEASESGKAADILAFTANNSAMTLEDLGETLKTAAPVGQMAGANLKDVAAAEAKGLIPEDISSEFVPSSLGFDPSRPLDGDTVQPGKRVLPSLAEKAKAQPCPDDVLKDMKGAPAPEPPALNLKNMPLSQALEKSKEETGKIGGFITEDIKAKHAEWTDNSKKSYEEYKKARKEYDKLKDEYYFTKKEETYSALKKQENEIIKQADIHNENVDKLQVQALEFTDLFAIEPFDRGKIKVSEPIPDKFKLKWGKAQNFLEKHISADYLNDTYVIKQYNGNRSEYNDLEKSLNMSNDAEVKVFVHELCHGIEENNPHVKERCLEFLEKRCLGEESKWLGKGYKKTEMGRKDKFFDPYCGKDYFGPDGKRNSTEILSMGAERLYNDPIGFIRQDQEYFNFVVDILRGNI